MQTFQGPVTREITQLVAANHLILQSLSPLHPHLDKDHASSANPNDHSFRVTGHKLHQFVLLELVLRHERVQEGIQSGEGEYQLSQELFAKVPVVVHVSHTTWDYREYTQRHKRVFLSINCIDLTEVAEQCGEEVQPNAPSTAVVDVHLSKNRPWGPASGTRRKYRRFCQ